MSYNEVYYRIFLNYEDLVCVITMQDFDEGDYDESRFFVDKDGYKHKFDTKKEAREWLNKNVKYEKIHPDDRLISFNQQDYMK